MDDNQTLVRLSVQQKTGFVLLLLFGLLTVGLAFLQMRNNIYVPLLEQKIASRQDLELPEILFDEELRLQQIDTDQDGINDYEELRYFQTSPYLPDTDSDGIDDKEELERGTDPLCPEGEECQALASVIVKTTSTPLSPLFENSQTAADIYGTALVTSGAADNPIDDGIDLAAAINNPDEIRELLLSTGQISREQLERLDDATLLEMAAGLLAEQQAQGKVTSVGSNTQGNEDAVLTDTVEIRRLLLESGEISQEQLDQIDDATLLQIAGDLFEDQ